MTFIEQLQKRWTENKTLVCVGLDPDPSRFPEIIGSDTDAIFAFNRAIIDARSFLIQNVVILEALLSVMHMKHLNDIRLML